MQDGNYGKEPFDLRLTLLRLTRNLHKIIMVTVAGTVFFGGWYTIKNIFLSGPPEYAALSVYKIAYVDEPSKSGDYYINEMSWNTYVHSTDFLDAVWKHLEEDTAAYDFAFVESKEQLAGMIKAKLDSDVHIPSTIVTTTSQAWSVLVAKAVEETMTQEFVEGNRELSDIRVMTPAKDAPKVEPDVRPVRAFLLAAILSGLFAFSIFLLFELGTDSIWLPATLRMRYGLAAVGTVNSSNFASNMAYRFQGKKRVAVCAVGGMEPRDVIAKLPDIAEWLDVREIFCRAEETVAGKICNAEKACSAIAADGCLVAVKAGSHAGKPLEYALECLAQQDIPVAAALLWDADEWLIRAYYRGWKHGGREVSDENRSSGIRDA